jgi:hypothetical protein
MQHKKVLDTQSEETAILGNFCDQTVLRARHRFFAALRFAFGRPRFFGAGGVFRSARTASSKLPVIGGTVVSACLRFATRFAQRIGAQILFG